MDENLVRRKNSITDPLSPLGFKVFLIVAILLIGGITSAYVLFSNYGEKIGRILGVDDTVIINGFIPWVVTFQVSPERRILPSNKTVEVDFRIRNPGTTTTVYNETITTNGDGVGVTHIQEEDLSPGTYDIAIKGISHLREVFENKVFGPGSAVTMDLTSPELRAGDSHPSSDNYVNSLDISYEALKLYTGDIRADLNRDTLVNSLEFPTLIKNLYQHGDN